MIFVAAALTLSLEVQRPAVDMLDGVGFEVVVHNNSSHPIRVRFPKPSEYEIQIRRGPDVVWTSLSKVPAGTHFPAHDRMFMPGPTVLTVFVWNGLANDGSVPAPGQYHVVATLLDTNPPAGASSDVRFIDPVPVAAVQKLKEGEELSIAGRYDAATGVLTDGSGSLRLMRRIATPSGSTIVVRGYVTTAPGGAKPFYVNRWAPLGKKRSTPMSTPTPLVRRH